MEMYNEFKEADVLPRMIDMKVNDIIKRLKPDQYEKLKQKIRLEALILRMVTTILTPFPARPSPKGKKKRSIDSIASGSFSNDYSSDDYSSGDESTADERTDEFDFLSHFSETCKEDKKDEKDEKTNLSDAAHLAYDIVQGDLQSGKTAIAALFSIIASELSVVTLMLTNTVSSSSDFTPKLRTFVWKMDMDIGKETDGTRELFANNIYCIKESDDTAINYFDGEKGFCSKAISEQGAVLVAGDTQIQIRKSRELIETMQLEHYCLLVMDECDIVHGKKYTNNASTELRLLLGLPLLGVVGISATTIPTFIDLMHAEAQNVKAYRLYPGANHVGPEQFKSPKDEDGNDIFLNPGDLNYKNKFINNTLLEFIDSALYEKDRRGTLVIVNLNDRVNAPGNVFEQASEVQNYFEGKNKEFIGITITTTSKQNGRAAPIMIKYPGAMAPFYRGESMWQVLDEINEEWGLDIPIVVFGFSQLTRGRSISSAKRVVTHIAVMRGNGHNLGNTFQAVGRGAYQGKDTLQSNGYDHVTILTTQSDYETIQHLNNFTNALFDRIESSDTDLPFSTVWSQVFPEFADIFRSTNRNLSPNKQHKIYYQKTVSCEIPTTLTQGEEKIKDEVKDDIRMQMLMRTVLDLHDRKSGEYFDSIDVQNSYHKRWKGHRGINLGKNKDGVKGVNCYLRYLVINGKLDKINRTDSSPSTAYRVKCRTLFEMLLNPQACVSNGNHSDDN
eukprot:scaffold15938_cov27-Cyclotella_meneghiniana.AAC.1